MSFIAGPYSAVWNSLAIGQTESGFEFTEPGIVGQPIVGDNFGPECHQDAVLSNGNAFITMVLNEYDAAAMRTILSPSGVAGRLFPSGILATSIAKVLVLTRLSASTTATPATRTANLAMLAPGQDITYLMSSGHRKVPIRFQLFPYLISTGVYGHFVDS
jgi:hypothetical protein